MGLSNIVRPIFTDFNFFFEVDIQLDSYKKYIGITKSVIETEVTEKIKNYKKLDKYSTEFGDHPGYDPVDEYILQNTSSLYYTSIFISMYSFFEKKLFQMCKVGETNQEIKLNDISGKGVNQYKKYINKVLKVDVDHLGKEWDDITKFNKLRNYIVHHPNNSVQKQNNLNIISVFKSINYLSVDDYEDKIVFNIDNSDLLITFMDIIEKYIEGLFTFSSKDLNK